MEHPVRHFIIRCVMAATVVVMPLVALVLLVPGKQDNFYAAILDKRILVEETPPPRIIIAGGSNAIFGLHSPTIESMTGTRTVNISHHLALGLEHIEEELARPGVSFGPGDLVVLCLEYQMFMIGGTRLDAIGLEADQATSDPWRRFVSADFQAAFDNALITWGSSIRSSARVAWGAPDTRLGSVYTRSAFNAHGDIRRDLLHGRTDPRASMARDFRWNLTGESVAEAVGRVNALATRAREAGASAVFIYPPVPRVFAERYGPDMAAFDALVRAGLDVPVLDTPFDAVLEDTMFFDYYYHPNFDGNRVRTARIGKLLARHLGVEPGDGEAASPWR